MTLPFIQRLFFIHPAHDTHVTTTKFCVVIALALLAGIGGHEHVAETNTCRNWYRLALIPDFNTLTLATLNSGKE